MDFGWLHGTSYSIPLSPFQPRKALQKELLELYRPVAHRFEKQEDWLPRMEQALKSCPGNNCAAEVKLYSLSLYVSIYLSVEMVRTQEALRSRAYERYAPSDR